MRHVLRGVRRASRIVSIGAGALIVILAALTVVDVVYRFATDQSIPGTVEYGELALVGVGYLALAEGQRRNAHVRVESISSMLPRRARVTLRTIAYVIGMLGMLWFAVITMQEAVHSISVGEARIGLIAVPVWPARVIIPVGLIMLTAELGASLGDFWEADREIHTHA